HEIKSVENGVVTIESSRYPFCFTGDPKSPDSTRSIIAFFPFNDDLNRFKLIVTGGSSDRYKINWGESLEKNSTAEVSKGINLAEEFLDNPFSAPVQDVERAIKRQQEHETPMIKKLLHPKNDEEKAKFADAIETSTQQDLALAKVAHDAVKSVTHVIKI